MKQLKNMLIFITLLTSLTVFSDVSFADCYFIRLRGFAIEHNPDAFFWGKLSPLIALEPGHFYPLAPPGMESVEANAGQATNLQGNFYYIPQHLFSDGHRFTLRIMVVDPDTDTPDDTLLPLSEQQIFLPPQAFSINSFAFTVDFQPFDDHAQAQSNQMSYHFEIRKRKGACDEDTAQGREEDLRHRQKNELNRLLVRVLSYDKPHQLGGREYTPYRLPQINENKFSVALAMARDTADTNFRELIKLGQEIHQLRGSASFTRVWEEYSLLLQRLMEESIPLHYIVKDVGKSSAVPSLLAHPLWKEFDNSGNRPVIPEEWGM